MRFYLASWVGDGTRGNPYRPNVGEARWAGLDLRPDATVQSGRVLVATPEPVASGPSGVLDLGDLAESIPRGVSRKLEDALGVTLDQFDSIQAIVAELLILHGDNRSRGSRTRWRPLKQDRRGRHRITMLGATLYDAPIVEGTVITDDFNRADSDSLGADWTEVAGNWQIVSNKLREDANQSGDNRVRNENDLASDDHYAEAVVSSITSNKRRGVACRFASAAQSFYSFNSRPAAGARELQKWVNGVETTLATDSTTEAVPFTIRLEVDGSSLDGKIGGVSVVTDTDTDITGNTRCGIVTQNGSTGNEDEASFFDDFEAGDLTSFDPANLQATVNGDDVTLTHDASF